jgi:hypothetical protein
MTASGARTYPPPMNRELHTANIWTSIAVAAATSLDPAFIDRRAENGSVPNSARAPPMTYASFPVASLRPSVSIAETSAMKPPAEVFANGRSFSIPISTSTRRCSRSASSAGSGSSPRPSAFEKSLPVPNGITPMGIGCASSRMRALSMAFNVPSPPAT